MLVIGLLILVASTASAVTYTAQVRVHPPVGSNTGDARMNCGWHTTCAPPYSDGNGVDWVSGSGTCCSTGTTVYYRSVNYMDVSHEIGDVHIRRNTQAPCYEIYAEIRNLGDLVAGTVIYQHADRVNTTYTTTLSASPTGVYSGAVTAGTMVSDEKCSAWTGPHVHEKHLTGFTSFGKNIGSPPSAIRRANECTPAPCKYTYPDPGSLTTVWERQLFFGVVIGCQPGFC